MSRLVSLKIKTSVHGGIIVSSPDQKSPWPLLLSFHGYGERADTNIKEILKATQGMNFLVCAVQALHPFYVSRPKKGRSSEIGASWMTSMDRRQAIEDNVAYVNQVVSELKKQYSTNEHITFVGFSQGVAMAWRSACLGEHKVSELVALGGAIPDDIEEDKLTRVDRALLLRGDRDSYYLEKTMSSDTKILEKRGVEVESLTLKGGHLWPEGVHEKMATWWREGRA